ncbi:MAG TPA: glycosyltransferase family 39 protein [Patescibacteria group bacterium]|nr:glycosyltransferase family 39 protein [Patescibacteria group bacterium]
MKKLDCIFITVIIVFAIAIRLYKINTTLTDHHSWRQADTASVARNFTKNGFDLLHPRYDDLSNIQSGQYNPQGYRFVEFPLYNAFFGMLYKYLPIVPIEIYGRFISIFFSLIIIIFLYYIVKQEEGRTTALITSLVFSFFPFFVFYSRTVLPDMTALSLSIISIVLLYRYSENKIKTKKFYLHLLYIFSVFSMMSALLIKPTVIFYYIAILYLFFKKHRFSVYKKISFYGYFFATMMPLLAWRIWIQQFKEGIPVSEWLFTQVNTSQGLQSIFFKPSFFRWIFEERILLLILGGYCVVFLIIGILKKPKKSYLFTSMGIGSLLYLFTFQGGNVQHDYYQIMILPILAIFSGIGSAFFIEKKTFFINQYLNSIVVIIIFILSFLFSYNRVKGFYDTNKDQSTIAHIIQFITPPNARIVTDTLGDTTLLYLADRSGFPAPTEDFDTLQKDGMEYFVTMQKDVAYHLKETYPLIFESDKVYILRLKP